MFGSFTFAHPHLLCTHTDNRDLTGPRQLDQSHQLTRPPCSAQPVAHLLQLAHLSICWLGRRLIGVQLSLKLKWLREDKHTEMLKYSGLPRALTWL